MTCHICINDYLKKEISMFTFMKDPLYNAQLVRVLGLTSYQGAEIGECIATTLRIKEGDKESWYMEWQKIADENLKQAHHFLAHGSFIDARYSFLRACTYYRASYFFLEDDFSDFRIAQALGKSIQAFHEAIKLFDHSVRMIEIPYKSYSLPAYLYINTMHSGKQPIIMTCSGGDGTKEEMYPCAIEALSRGYHCLTFEGPGQGSVLRLKQVPFIPNWEDVVEKVVDFAYELPEVDTHNIIYIGRSFGGYLAARAVTTEKRISACIVDPGQFDQFSNLEKKISSLAPDKSLAAVLQTMIDSTDPKNFMIKSRLERFGAKNAEEFITRIREYTLESFAENITCPMLVFDNEEEYLSLGQAKKLFDHLTCPKEYYLFKADEYNGGHCQPLIPRIFFGKVFEWIKKYIKGT